MLGRISVKWLILVVILVAHLFFWGRAWNLFTLGNECRFELLYLDRILYYLPLNFRDCLLLLLGNVLLTRHRSLPTFWCAWDFRSRLQFRG